MKIDKGFYKSLLFLAIPVILQNMVNSFINILDTIMVGKLGEVAIASVGLGNQVFFFFNMILFGITSGGGIFVAQYWGKKDIKNIRASVGITIACSLGVSLIFFLAAQFIPKLILGFYSEDITVIELGAKYLKTTAWSYPIFAISMAFSLAFRSTEQAKVPMTATIISLCINALCNYLLIFGVSINGIQIIPSHI
jgi:Na+-driven multidrug efflux pump